MKPMLLAILVVHGGVVLSSPHPATAQAALFAPEEEARQWAESVLAKMPLEKKVAQLVFVDVTGGYVTGDDPRLAKWIRLVRDSGVGGVVFYGGTPRNVAWLLNHLQKEAAIPVLMAADFEAGPGQQVTGATEFPGDMALAAIGSEDLVYRVARTGAVEGRAMGIHLTYSPVVDVLTRPESPAESVRSFGGDIDLLGKLVKAYVRGYMENGMLTTAKHFPGRGNISASPNHPGFSTIDRPAAAVENEEMMAFKKAIEAGVPFIMTEHISVPSLTDGSDLPASVEKKLATGWIRERLGFQGLLTSDDLWYDAVVERFGKVQVGVKALQAGHDLLLKPKDPVAMIEGVVEAVKSGEIPEAHINQAVSKLLYWKARLNLHKNRFVDESKVHNRVGTREHWQLAQEVADRSLTLLKNEGVLPLRPEGLQKIVNVSVQKHETDPYPDMLAAKLQTAFPEVQTFTLRPGTDPLFVQRDRLGDAAPLRPADLALIERMIAAKSGKVLAMSYGNPYLIGKLPDIPAFVVGYGERGWFGNQSIYFESFVKLLKGEIKPQGRLPVKVNEEYPIGSASAYSPAK
jgi:beta-N-acetylhexosaminidase